MISFNAPSDGFKAGDLVSLHPLRLHDPREDYVEIGGVVSTVEGDLMLSKVALRVPPGTTAIIIERAGEDPTKYVVLVDANVGWVYRKEMRLIQRLSDEA
jgi:hypothetical protein